MPESVRVSSRDLVVGGRLGQRPARVAGALDLGRRRGQLGDRRDRAARDERAGGEREHGAREHAEREQQLEAADLAVASGATGSPYCTDRGAAVASKPVAVATR